MSNIRKLLETLEDINEVEKIDLHDSIDFELNENFVVETGVVGFTEDGIVLEADQTVLELLEVNDILVESEELDEEKPGLWANIRKRKASGKPPRKPGSKGAPTKQDFVNAKKTSKNESMDYDDAYDYDDPKHPDFLDNADIMRDLLKHVTEPGKEEVKEEEDELYGLRMGDDVKFRNEEYQDWTEGYVIDFNHDTEEVELMLTGPNAGETVTVHVHDVEAVPGLSDDEYDGQPSTYDEYQDLHGGDDWDHGQYDNDMFEANDPEFNFQKEIDDLIMGIHGLYSNAFNWDYSLAASKIKPDRYFQKGSNGAYTFYLPIPVQGLEGGQGSSPSQEFQKPYQLLSQKLSADQQKFRNAGHYFTQPAWAGDAVDLSKKSRSLGPTNYLMFSVRDDSQKMKENLDDVMEAEYQGRKVPLGKPMAGDVKKSKVYVRKPNGKVVKVNFGDKKMKIKKSNPKRRKSFRARHRCENPGPRWKARYWSCRAW